MKNTAYIQALCLLLLLGAATACEHDGDDPKNTVVAKPIGFYATVDATVTRADPYADPADYTTADVQAMGFGAFCWYTGTNDMLFDDDGDIERFTPPTTHIGDQATYELMRNQKVEYVNGQWTYAPTKYWPLVPDEKLTFRAYAPYTDNLLYDEKGMPWLPVIVQADDYCTNSQKDPLWGTGKHVTGVLAENVRYGELYNNYTLAMSGSNIAADERDGVIDWYFHHGMAKLGVEAMVSADHPLEEGEYVYVEQIYFGPLYDHGLLYVGSHTENAEIKPVWTDRSGDIMMTVAYQHGTTTPAHNDLNGVHLDNTNWKYIALKGTHIIPRDYSVGTPLELQFTYREKRNGQAETINTATAHIDHPIYGNTIYMLNLTLNPTSNTAYINMRVDLEWQTGTYTQLDDL